LGNPCSARAGSEWYFPSAPEPVVKVRSVFMVGEWDGEMWIPCRVMKSCNNQRLLEDLAMSMTAPGQAMRGSELSKADTRFYPPRLGMPR
jgi:hypothetical protein